MSDRPRPVAAGPTVEAHALPLCVVTVPVPGALRVELCPSRDLSDLEDHRGGGGHGEKREVSKLCLEKDGCRVAVGRVAEHGGGVGIAVVPCHGYLERRRGARKKQNNSSSSRSSFSPLIVLGISSIERVFFVVDRFSPIIRYFVFYVLVYFLCSHLAVS